MTTLRQQLVKEMGQEISCPIHLLFHFNAGALQKITLEDSDDFKVSFLGVHSKQEQIIDWLDHYFQKKPLPFPFPLIFPKGGSFTHKVLEKLQEIPMGSTLSYQEVAVALGSPGAARAVGNACHNNPFPFVIPCHRVLKQDGTLGGFAYGTSMKKWLLDFERSI